MNLPNVLTVGRILLFYTPRKLLSSQNISLNSPDFLEKKLIESIEEFSKRERRFGKISDQI